MKWLLTTAWGMFVVGGLIAGWVALGNFATLARAPAPRTTAQNRVTAQDTVTGPDASSAVGEAVPVATSTVVPVAAPPPLRDFDQNPPPFAAAGTAEVQPTPEPSSPAGRLTILLMGIDQRPDEAAMDGDPGRTDSMLLVSIDYDTHSASMASIPRDGFVVIPDHGNERVNAAYTFGEIDKRGGGPALAKRTVAQLFGVPVDRYALVDIHSMEQVIDALGGVWIDNPNRLIDRAYPTDDYRTITIDIPAGRQLMDGVTAVEYARTRHPDSDYGRQTRQQQVLLAVRDQALQLNVLSHLPVLVPQLLNLVRTDLSPLEIVQVANFGRDLDRSRDIVTLPPNPSLTPSYTGPGGAAYINLTSAFRAAVRAMVVQPRIVAEHAEIGVYNAGAPAGSGGKVATLLERGGVSVVTIDTATPVEATRIEAGAGARQTAALMAGLLDLPPQAVVVDGDSTSVRVLLGPDLRLPKA